MHYCHPNLEKMDKYYRDFGFVEAGRTEDPKRIFYKEYNDQPVLLVSEQTTRPIFFGGAMEAASEDDLQRAAAIPGASSIRNCKFPGGGKIVSLTDPDRMPFHIVYGYSIVPRREQPKGAKAFNKAEVNDEIKPRRGAYQRVEPGPAPVQKLGHFGHITLDMIGVPNWYMKHFNIRVMDIQALPWDKLKLKIVNSPNYNSTRPLNLISGLCNLLLSRPWPKVQ